MMYHTEKGNLSDGKLREIYGKSAAGNFLVNQKKLYHMGMVKIAKKETASLGSKHKFREKPTFLRQ